jgi:CheY-like chemotaxis protein
VALGEIENARPDVVITDVIMPEKDGYEVCQFIKNHPELAKTPVILMSGVVNRAVAERAFAVKADELLRKPFQPPDLVARVKSLLKPGGNAQPAQATADAAAVLSGIFGTAPAPAKRGTIIHPVTAGRTALAAPPVQRPANGVDPAKLKVEILRLEGLVKKLQSELQAEREYSQALEAHIKTLQEVE